MEKMILVKEQELNEELKLMESLGARMALNDAIYILRHDITQKDADDFMWQSKYFRQETKANPYLSLISIAKFYRLIVNRAEKEHPEFFKSIINQINSKEN